MILASRASSKWLAVGAAFLGLLPTPMAARADPAKSHPEHTAPVEAQFRGCESAGWCRFRIEPWQLPEESLLRVRPDGVARRSADDAASTAVRDRLNALLASMIHQHKRVVLQDLRELDDGTFAATVTVNGADVAADPLLLELQR
jgi:hypothetical protein